MDKKKLQDFIQKLQEMATQLNEADSQEEAQSITAMQIEDSAVQPIDTSTNSSTSNFVGNVYEFSDYITLKLSNGSQIGCNDLFALSGNDYFTVEINYPELISSRGYNISIVESCTLVVCARSRRAHAGGTIYSLNNNELVGINNGVNNLYTIDLKSLYETYGNAGFKFVANWDGSDSVFLFNLSIDYLSLKSLNIITPPDKRSYKVGESFDKTGMVINGKYSDGSEIQITDYTITPSGALSRSNNYVTIKKGNKSVRQNIEVDRQNVKCSIYGEERSRSSEEAEWGDWQPSPALNCVVLSGPLNQWHSSVKIDKSQIDMGNDEKIGLLLGMYVRDGLTGSHRAKHIRINSSRVALNSMSRTQYFYIGEIKKGDTGNIEVMFEYDDGYLEFGFNNSEPTVYFVKNSDPTIKKETKTFSLAEGEMRIDMANGMPVYELTDIEADSTPLGIKISHIISPDEGNDLYGDMVNMNLNERLDVDAVDYNEYVKTHRYTDGYGNKHLLNVLFYYIYNGTRRYLTGSLIENIEVHKIGDLVLGYYFEGHKVYLDYLTPDCQVYTKEISSSISNNSYYKSVLSDAVNLPVNWLRCDNVMKGFNADGDLVLIIDEFGNYTAIRRGAEGIINSVEDKNGNYISFNYDSNGRLSYIDYSGNRRVRYTYVQVNVSGFPERNQLNKVEYCKIENDGTVSDVYKTVNLNYCEIINRRLPAYSLSGVTSSDKLNSSIIYELDDSQSMVKKITTRSTQIPDGTTTGGILAEFRFSYDYNKSLRTITDDYDNQYNYIFGLDGNLSDYYEIKNGKVSEYRKHEYTVYSQNVVKYAKRSLLNKKPLSSFVFAEGNSETDLLNLFNKITTSTVIEYTDSAKIKTYTYYSYDDMYRCNKESVTTEYSDLNNSSLLHKEKTVTDYIYDSTKRILSKKITHSMHYDGENEVKDKSYVTEYSYNSQGYLADQITYNGIWATHDYSGTCTCNFSNSDKFYSQYAYDSSGRITQSKTQDGLYYDSYEYYEGTLNVKSISRQGRSDTLYAYNNENCLTKVSATDGGLENCAITEYSLGEKVELNHSGNRPIEFEYDGKRRVSKIKLDGSDYLSFTYEEKVQDGANTVDKVTSVNANSETMMAVAARDGSFDKLYYNSQLILQHNYNDSGYLTSTQDNLAGITETFSVGTYGNLNSYSRSASGENYSENYSYDFKGNITQISYSGTVVRTDAFTYKADCENNITKIVTGAASDITILPTYDISNRYTGATAQISDIQLSEGITYYKNGDHATNLPKVYNYTVKKNGVVKSSGQMSLAYDSCENISSIIVGGEEVKYTYDSVGRLIREENEQLGQTYTYTYDNNGNILTKKIGSTTITYSYDGDKLVSYNGQNCVYDALGNPTTYRGKSATWVRGRKLVSFNGNNYTYDAPGRRLSKNNIKFYYDCNGKLLKQSNGLEFYYDAVGVIAIKYSGAIYLCRKDMLGNIIALIDSNGNTVVQYKYDAWGNHKVINSSGMEITDINHIGNLNPFRYRGYYYDTETGLYFLKSRYYDPEVGRFINMDSVRNADPESVNGINLFAYCGDNPVMGYDPDGTWSWSGFWNIVAAVAVVVAVTAAVALTAGAAAVAVGASSAVVTAVTAGAAIGGTVVGSLEIANQVKENGAENIDIGSVAKKTFMGSVTGAKIGMSVGNFIAAGGVTALSGGAFALAGGGTVSVGSTLALTNVGAIAFSAGKAAISIVGVTYLLASDNRPGDNRRQNEQFKAAMRELGITNKTDPRWRRGHDALHSRPPMGYKQLVAFLKNLLNL